jgi:hypothetical protein
MFMYVTQGLNTSTSEKPLCSIAWAIEIGEVIDFSRITTSMNVAPDTRARAKLMGDSMFPSGVDFVAVVFGVVGEA